MKSGNSVFVRLPPNKATSSRTHPFGTTDRHVGYVPPACLLNIALLSYAALERERFSFAITGRAFLPVENGLALDRQLAAEGPGIAVKTARTVTRGTGADHAHQCAGD